MLGSLPKAGRLSDVASLHSWPERHWRQWFHDPILTAVVFMMRRDPWASCLAMFLPASQIRENCKPSRAL